MLAAPARAQVNTTLYLTGATDADNNSNVAEHSAVEAVSATTIAVADNENNTLRLYAIVPPPAGATPVPIASVLATASFLNLTEARGSGRIREADFEAATRLHGTNIIAWAGSHSRSNDPVPVWRGNRHRIFGTSISGNTLNFTGVSYYGTAIPDPAGAFPANYSPPAGAAATFLNLMIGWDTANGSALQLSTHPRHRNINLEGLADKVVAGAGPEGLLLAGAYFGLRAPLTTVASGTIPASANVPANHAIVFEVSNILDVVTTGQAPAISRTIVFNLGGQGIRSMTRIGQDYLINAGGVLQIDPAVTFQLYKWNGVSTQIAGSQVWLADAPVNLNASYAQAPNPSTFGPEGMCVFPAGSNVLNDGSLITVSDDSPGPGRLFRTSMDRLVKLENVRRVPVAGGQVAAFDLRCAAGGTGNPISLWRADNGGAFPVTASATVANPTGANGLTMVAESAADLLPVSGTRTRVYRAQQGATRALNGAGYTWTVTTSSNYSLLTNHFDDGAGNLVGNLVFPAENGVQVFRSVDGSSGNLATAYYDSATGWDVPSFSIAAGETVWVLGASKVFFHGRVNELGQRHEGGLDYFFQGQIHPRIIAFPISGNVPVSGDGLTFFDESSQNQLDHYFSAGNWSPALPNLAVGKGYFTYRPGSALPPVTRWETGPRSLWNW